MNEDVRVSKELVVSFWRSRVQEAPTNSGAYKKLCEVEEATPDKLISDYKAIRHILGRAIKELEKI
jgi:hypothetical protein